MKGFTLIEILIVVILLGILAAIVVPMFSDTSAEAQAAACDTNMSTIRSQAELYRARNNTYPTTTAMMVGTQLQEDVVCPTDGAYDLTASTADVLSVVCGDH